MGETHRLDDGVDQVDISPIQGYNEPDNSIRATLRINGGLTTTHEFGRKRMYELPLNNISESDADQLMTWWSAITTLTLTVDLAGGSEYSLEVKITDMERPMQMWGGDWDTLFGGVLTLHEHSSISFSSSSESVSGSRSCSVSYSFSVSVGWDVSCSVWDSDSRSSSVGSSWSCSDSVSRSCSDSMSRSCSTYSVSSSACENISVSSCEDLSSTSCSLDPSSIGVVIVPLGESSCSSYISISSTGSIASESCSVSGAG